ncbi:MAG: ATP-binding protein [Pseudomonadota bacterium]
MTVTAFSPRSVTGSALRGIALEVLADLCPDGGALCDTLAEEAGLALMGRVGALSTVLAAPPPRDAALVAAGGELGLDPLDLVIFALCEAVEALPAAAAAVRALQGDALGASPTLGLLTQIADHLGIGGQGLPATRLLALGLLVPRRYDVPAVEMPLALSDAARAAQGVVPSAHLHPIDTRTVAEPWRVAAARIAALTTGPVTLVMREGDRADRIAFAAAIAAAAGRTAVRVAEPVPGLGAALTLTRWLPVEELDGPLGDRRTAHSLAPFQGPRVVIAPPQGTASGAITTPGSDVVDIQLPPLSCADRNRLWQALLPDGLPDGLSSHRYGPARVGRIAARAKLSEGPLPVRLRRAMGADLAGDMAPHAALVPRDCADDALALSDIQRADLRLLLSRCRARHERADTPAGPPRRPGVRALFSGPPGTGKTFACSWLATRLGLPLFKLDLSAVVSKYIGETEENLAKTLAQAEAADCVLLIDEADTLFGARVDGQTANDKFSNNQTNFLLSRIETFDGIVCLTTNNRERIDAAFARRIDQVVEFPLPGPNERRLIWLLHLGESDLAGAQINRLAAQIDLAGGHIANIAETAALMARDAGRPIRMDDMVAAVEQEYRKLSRTMPSGLTR